jgi:hypothetical protein
MRLNIFIFVVGFIGCIRANELRYLEDLQLPLRTQSRWIVDQSGHRVKFACVNWPAHMKAMVPEGLAYRSVENLARHVRSMGFNCVRLTFSSEQVENFHRPLVDILESPKQTRPASSRFYHPSFWLKRKMMTPMSASTYELFKQHNGPLDGMTVLGFMHRTMKALREAKVFVILDNHISDARWCCGSFDGNRWWNDRSFRPDKWLHTLETISNTIRELGWTNVVGIGLRNEVNSFFDLRSTANWYKYVNMDC